MTWELLSHSFLYLLDWFAFCRERERLTRLTDRWLLFTSQLFSKQDAAISVKTHSAFVFLVLLRPSSCSLQFFKPIATKLSERVFVGNHSSRNNIEKRWIPEEIYFPKFVLRRRTRSILLHRVSNSNVYPSSCASQSLQHLTLWHEISEDATGRCHTSIIKARISQKCHSTRCRVASSPNYWPLVHNVFAFCTKIALKGMLHLLPLKSSPSGLNTIKFSL